MKTFEQFNQEQIENTEFAEWTSFEGWYLKELDIWVNKVHPNLQQKTSKELYKVFQDSR